MSSTNTLVKETHDRTLGGVIGSMLAYAAIVAFSLSPTDVQSAAIYTAAGTLGAQIGAKVPEEYRVWIWSAGGFALALLGVA